MMTIFMSRPEDLKKAVSDNGNATGTGSGSECNDSSFEGSDLILEQGGLSQSSSS
jgi:hypothetical protein